MGKEIEMILRLVLASALGAAIGFQREKSNKPAGLRTITLISFGSALFTLVSIYGFGGGVVDPSRIAAGVVTGVGFLGAGAILHGEHGFIVGLTTAATVWAAAALGVAVGAGLYLLSLVSTAIILIILFLPHPIR
jgi:putative Mg2+ transporter-C (MgtC) family protein